RHTRFSRDWSSDVCSSDLGLSPDGARALGGARGLHALRHLAVGWNTFGDEGNAALAGSPLLARLDTLDLSTTRFGPLAAAALARSEERRVGKEWRSRRAPQ